ncbi:MAG: saccharopine dehydrogenase C-terminal domain-containing protein [Asgard group archaeon]|nr:saccharopine dehydrogenase C-terminal domain-containing protein [Asgard group archaeon]
MKKVLIFGAGLVAKPGTRYLLDNDYEVTIATRTVSKAEDIIAGHPNGTAIEFNVAKDDLEKSGLIQEHDLVVSLLPYKFHPQIAKSCVKYKTDMATTSYVSDEMQKLDEQAKEADIILLNECGVDPGIDHMSAMRVIHDIQENEGKVISFRSITGGLPAPQSKDNPLGYKFSWSPKGVILAGTNPAKYMENGEIINIKSGDLFNHYWPMTVEGMDLEYYPNRNSLPYIDVYGLENINTMFRGTFRYPGWCETIQSLFDLGLLDQEEEIKEDLKNATWRQLLMNLLGLEGKNLQREVAHELGKDPKAECIQNMAWLDLFSNKKIPDGDSYLDVIATQFLDKLGKFSDDEQDMIVMLHEFIAEYPDGRKEKSTSTLIDYGIPNGDSSMARTVSLPLGIAVKMILEGDIKDKGVTIPIKPEIYNPILDELEKMDIAFEEEVKDL